MRTMEKWMIAITMVVKNGEVGAEVLYLQNWKVNLNLQRQDTHQKLSNFRCHQSLLLHPHSIPHQHHIPLGFLEQASLQLVSANRCK